MNELNEAETLREKNHFLVFEYVECVFALMERKCHQSWAELIVYSAASITTEGPRVL